MPEAIPENNLIGGKKWSKGLINIIKFSIKYAKKHKCKIVFPLKRDKKKQKSSYDHVNKEYIKQLSKEELFFFRKNSVEKKFYAHTSYFAVFQSKLTIGSSSTMLKERLGYGGKVLGCNFTPEKINEFPIKGLCNLSGIQNNNFSKFEKRVNKILKMSKKDYFQKLSKPNNYVLDYDKTISTKQKIILEMNKIIEDAKQNI